MAQELTLHFWWGYSSAAAQWLVIPPQERSVLEWSWGR